MIKKIINLVIIILLVATTGCEKEYTGCDSAGISIDEFEKIQIGDSEYAVARIIDPADEWNDDNIYDKCVIETSNEKKDKIYSFTYKYLGQKKGYAIITYTTDYTNGGIAIPPTVTKKEQFNLK